VAELAPDELSQALAALVSAEFVFEKSLYPELEYAFKHPLTHEVAYLSQLGDRRARTHAAVAKAIEAADADSLDERAALLAHHWEQAGDAAKAAQWHRRAALWCERDNPGDALMHWRRVRALLGELSDDPARAAIRLEAARSCLNMGWRQGMLDDTHEIFEEGRALARQLGDLRQEIVIVSNLASNLCLSGRPAEAFVLTEEAQALLEKSGDPELACVVLDSVMNARFYTGSLDPALEVAARRIVIAEEIGLEVDELDVPVAWYAGYQGWFAIQTGRLGWAGERIRSGEARVRSCGYPQARGWWSIAMADLEIACGRGREALAHARHGIDVGEEVASALVSSWGNNAYGEACVISGDHELGVHHLKLGVEIARAQRAFLSQEARMLAALALAQLAAGDAQAAIASAEAGVEAGVARKTRAYEARARSVLARVLVETEGLAAAARVRAELEACEALIRDTGAGLYLPHVCELRASLARRQGDDETAAFELNEAYRLYAESGATGHAERLAAELRN
jgi:adenylate cyclase